MLAGHAASFPSGPRSLDVVSRRMFLSSAALAPFVAETAAQTSSGGGGGGQRPVVVGSSNGLKAAELALERMKAGTDPLDAVIAGANLVEDDPKDMSVGYGGIPNEEGVVQLDACVMHGPSGRAGAVAALEGIKNPTRVAKVVMETTDHILLVGPGARSFAEMNGFPVENLLTEKARKVWLSWKQNLSAKDKRLEPDPSKLDPEVQEFLRDYGRDPFRDPRSHGTIHLSACDGRGDLAGCTSTSGLFFKMPGRVGDSALIGAGCFVDNGVGAAGSTGRGEANILISGGHLIVERIRAGRSPKDACLDALRRVVETTKEKRLLDEKGRPAFGISFYAVNKSGAYAGATLWSHRPSGKPAQFAVADARGARLESTAYLYEGKPTL
jgi:N4-(beta-N-acetylglucosaminyl)-L-asparaginase